jgi:hypothetical protein
VTEVEVPSRAGQWPGEITLKRLARYASRTILSLDLGLGEKGRTLKWASLSRRKMTFHFSTMMVTRGSSVLISRSGAWTGGPRTHQSNGGGTLPSVWRRGHLDLQWLPLHMGYGPGGV